MRMRANRKRLVRGSRKREQTTPNPGRARGERIRRETKPSGRDLPPPGFLFLQNRNAEVRLPKEILLRLPVVRDDGGGGETEMHPSLSLLHRTRGEHGLLPGFENVQRGRGPLPIGSAIGRFLRRPTQLREVQLLRVGRSQHVERKLREAVPLRGFRQLQRGVRVEFAEGCLGGFGGF